MEDLKVIVTPESLEVENFEELKENIKGFVSLYEEAQVDESNVSDAKKHLAALRKMQKALNDEKIKVKDAYMQKYNIFEGKVKELIGLIDEPVKLIDKQVKECEEAEKKKKEELVRKLYETTIPKDMQAYVTYERAFKPTWLNKSTKRQTIIDDLNDLLMLANARIDNLKVYYQDKPLILEKALEEYAKCFDMEKVYDFGNKLIEFEKQTKEEPKEEVKEEEIKTEEPVILPFSDAEEDEEFELFTYVAYVSKGNEQAFIDFCQANNISFIKE
jgi:hypothetical protein